MQAPWTGGRFSSGVSPVWWRTRAAVLADWGLRTAVGVLPELGGQKGGALLGTTDGWPARLT